MEKAAEKVKSWITTEKSSEKLKRWDEVEKEVGKLIPGTPSYLNRYFGEAVPFRFLWNKEFDGLVLRAHEDFIPARGLSKLKVAVLEKNMAKVKRLLDFYKEKNGKLCKDEKLITDSTLARKWRIPVEQIISGAEAGKYDELLVDESLSEISGRTVYYFDAEKIGTLKVNTIPELCKHFDYPKRNAIGDYIRKGYIKQPPQYEGTNLWELDDLLRQIPQALKMAGERFQDSPRKNMGGTFDELLGEQLNSIINDYLSVRKIGTPLVDPWFGNRYGKLTDLEQHRLTLQRVLYKIICNRAGIKGYEQVNARNTFRELDQDELNNFKEAVLTFDIKELNAKDIDAARKGHNSDNVWYRQATIFIKPFVMYIFKEIEDDVDETNEKEKLEFFNVKKRFKKIVERLTVPKHEPETKRVKVFLNRLENVLIFNHLEAINTTHATSWMLTFLAGIRPEELQNIRLEHFSNPLTGQSWLDGDGFLKPDLSIKTFYNQDGTVDEKYGYVRLFLPAKATKQQRTPSDPILGTLIVPALVNQINKYLREELYSECPIRGTGYLFRRTLKNPESQLKTYPTYISDERKKMPFLTDLQKKWMVLKDGRRSMNDLILDAQVTGVKYVKLLRTAQVQMRHKRAGLEDSISENHYAKGISDSEYVHIISETLEYPIDPVELLKWELEKGYRDTVPEEYEAHFPKSIAKIQKELEERKASTPDKEELLELNKLRESIQNEFEKMNTILLLPSRKQKERLKEEGYTVASLISHLSDIEEQLETIDDQISKKRKGL